MFLDNTVCKDAPSLVLPQNEPPSPMKRHWNDRIRGWNKRWTHKVFAGDRRGRVVQVPTDKPLGKGLGGQPAVALQRRGRLAPVLGEDGGEGDVEGGGPVRARRGGFLRGELVRGGQGA